MRVLTLLTTLAACVLPSVYGHTYLVSPKPRNFAKYQNNPVQIGDVVKYPYNPTTNANNIVGGWCGSEPASQTPGPIYPSVTVSNFPAGTQPVTTNNTYVAGGTIKVYWYHPLAHSDPNTGSAANPVYKYGIRVAVNYSATDMVVLNVHTGGPSVSPIGVVNTHIEPGTGYDPVAIQDPGFVPSTTFTLPAGKTCNSCVLQFWLDAFSDKGSYIDCADIKILAAAAPPATTPTTGPTTRAPTGQAATTRPPTAQAPATPVPTTPTTPSGPTIPGLLDTVKLINPPPTIPQLGSFTVTLQYSAKADRVLVVEVLQPVNSFMRWGMGSTTVTGGTKGNVMVTVNMLGIPLSGSSYILQYSSIDPKLYQNGNNPAAFNTAFVLQSMPTTVVGTATQPPTDPPTIPAPTQPPTDPPATVIRNGFRNTASSSTVQFITWITLFISCIVTLLLL